MAQRPIIGVTGPDKGGLIAWLMTALALTRCGAKAVRLTPSRAGRFGRIEDIKLDALVIGGGTDVDPFHYGQQSNGQESEAAEDLDSVHRRTPLDWLVGLVLGVFRALFATWICSRYIALYESLSCWYARSAASVARSAACRSRS